MATFLIKTDSYHLLNEELKRVQGEATNVTTFSLLDVTIQECLEDASYLGMFAEKRLLVIKDVKYFGGKFSYEEESKAILNYLNAPSEETTVVFVCDDIKKTKDLTKEAIRLGVIIKDLSTSDVTLVTNVIDNYLEERELRLDADARELLLKNTLNNLDIFLMEIDKLSFVDKHITLAIVKEYGSVEPEDETFNFSNAVVAKNFTVAFDLLDKLLASGAEVIALIGLLASSFTNMYMVKDAVLFGLSDEEIAKKLGYSSTGRVYVMKKNGKIYTLEQLKEIIIHLSELDQKIKTGYNPVYGIKEFLLSL